MRLGETGNRLNRGPAAIGREGGRDLINIELPEFDFDINVTGWKVELGKENDRETSSNIYDLLEGVTWKKGGVYFLYENNRLLYIGRSINLKQRLIDHLRRSDNTTREYVERVTSVKGFLVWDIADQEIYETYAIKTLRPKLNKAKTHKIKKNYGRLA